MGCVKLVFFMLHVFLFQLVSSSSLPHLCPEDQALALLQFKNMFTVNPDASGYCYDMSTGVEIQSYPRTLSWNKSTDCCSWDGVHCDETTGQVIALDLCCSQLQGKFYSNSSLFQLSNLKRLDLSFNHFTGSPISPQFGEFSDLTHLDLSYSSFTGLIPFEISHLSKLHVLRISNLNELSIGPQNFELLLKNLTQLRDLNLESVNISSTIPSNFSSHLTNLRLSDTELRGVLPERVFHLSDLEFLDLSGNPQLTVRFPTTKWNSSASLVKLYLSRVNIAGNIPDSFSYITALHELGMGDCNLSGPIPKPLWNLTNIESLDLPYNHLEGSIPQLPRFEKLKELSLRNNNFDGGLEFLSFNRSWTQLELLDFSSNSLTGPIPSNVSGLRNLHTLYLSSNNLNGSIPSWIFDLPSLIHLYLSNNTFSGKIQEFKSKTLSTVTLKQNKLEGPIPNSLLNQNSLSFLLLSHNNITGHISSSICNLKTLIVLDLGSNNLEGTIPQCVGEMKENLFDLDLSNNTLSGTINTTFSVGNSLRDISLNGNKLTGKVPRSLINCKYLRLLDLGNNQLNDTFPNWLGYLPDLKILSLRSNKLHGPIKSSGNTNLFEGRIPSIIGDLVGLRTLNLSHNVLEGHIPASLQNLSVLESLDLSSNKISGAIPQQLASLTFLEVLKLSHNHLVGCIPKGKQFDSFENSSYQGNDGLRGFPLSKLCGGDDQVTTPAELDQQQEEEDSPMISWQGVLMGYGCGLMVFEDGFNVGTHNYYENEKAQEKILVSSYTSRIHVDKVSEDAD
ncbi:hypothetical protein EJD97_013137 [Solanum chilense]|uniref:Leucine-rich repeat-containing N-terminal plant-type domain-containing protein n=1 Tax=Solanum chilense TaxID=4083 RepID=A0A6N2BBQ6_SOLCI|nr:hypothetical protein EJD97_013137 [Solanum chilense]